MKELFNSISDKEKKALRFLCFLLAGLLLFLLLFSLPQRKRYLNALTSLSAKQSDYQYFDRTSQEKKSEWLRWQEARQDMEELRTKYFYNDKEGFKQLRLDLEQILSEARIHVSRKKFDYADFEKEKIKKVNVSFNIKGPYLSLKRFIHTVEKFQRFLVVEKVDFLNIDAGGRVLELKIVLAGYYEG